MIKGYGKGANITVLNTYYQYPKRNEDGKYTDDIMTIVYKDLDTGEKKIEEILNPEYRFFKAKDDVYIDHNLLFIDQNDVIEVSVPYKDLLKYIDSTIFLNTGCHSTVSALLHVHCNK